jgi:hypothetical protein
VGSVGALDFGSNLSSLTFTLGGNGCGEPAAYSASSDADWLTPGPASGQVPPGGSAAITVRIDRARLPRGGATTLEIKGTWGTLSLSVRVSPALTVAPSATHNQADDPADLNTLRAVDAIDACP